jgi:hypothetical protein
MERAINVPARSLVFSRECKNWAVKNPLQIFHRLDAADIIPF